MFIAWVRAYLDPDAEFTMSMHLHEGNNAAAARSFWRSETALPDAGFTKAYIKPRGTGHRKNHLPYGICRVRVRNPVDHWSRVVAWIEVVREHFGPLLSSS